MIDRLEILWSRLRHALSRTRWSARLLGHMPPPPHSDAAGLILIQLDGLGRSALRRALDDGHMPFLKRLLRSEGHELRPLYSGLPSNTPGFQAELFYGRAGAVPAFRYRDPGSKTVRRMDDPEWVGSVEAGLAAERGLLEGGSAWSGIYHGGAAETHLTVSPSPVNPGPTVRGRLRILGIMAAHAWSAARVFFNLAFTTAIAMRDWVRGKIDRSELVYELRSVPFRVLVGAALREVITAGACIDAERGLPVIHLNFAGFDELAHRRGPGARSARWALKGIDHCVERVWSAAHRSKGRDYQVWVYSDHGHEPVLPFSRRSDRSLPEVVSHVYRMVRDIVGAQGVPPPSLAFPPVPGEARTAFLASKFPDWLSAGAPERKVGPLHPGGTNGHGAGPGAGRKRPPEASEEADGKPEEGAIEVVYQGPLGFVYLPTRHERAFLAWFAEVLAVEGAIPWVLLREGDDAALAFSADGRFFRLPEHATEVLGADHPNLEAVAGDLVHQVQHPASGDLLLLGWDLPRALSFEEELGTHGGPGPAETSAFVVFPPETLALNPVPGHLRPRDLRAIALRLLDRRERAGAGLPGPMVPRPFPATGAEEFPDAVPLRLMTYNVHGCRGMDGKFAPQRIARVIARERPDVVCLQELDQERTRSGGIDQVAVIASRLQADYRFHAVAEVDDGAFGNAVLSAHPLRVVAAGPLPGAARVKDVFNLEDRGALWVTLDVGGRTVNIINTHLSILERERRIQVEALLGPKWLRHPAAGGPVILTGDFNASPDSQTVRRLETVLRSSVGADRKDRNLRTWSGRMPLRRIDHVMVRGGIEVSDVYVPRTRLSRVASDHLPLVVDLVCRFPAAEPVESSLEH